MPSKFDPERSSVKASRRTPPINANAGVILRRSSNEPAMSVSRLMRVSGNSGP